MNGIIYKGFEDIVGDFGKLHISKILESLAKKGAITIKKSHYALFCPTCKSVSVFSKYSCPHCENDNIDQIQLIEHSLCGYTGMIEEFDTGTKYICPNCKIDMSYVDGKLLTDTQASDSKGDFKVIGISFNCEKCDTRFDKPIIIHICQNCEMVFDYKRALYGKYYEFEVPSETFISIRRGFNIKVLLIEDNTDDSTLIMRILSDEEKTFTVEHVDTGDKAVTKLKDNYYDIILLDYLLPDTNGVELLEVIKDEEIKIPVIIFTGADDRETAVEAMKLGAADYILKSEENYRKLRNKILQLLSG